MPNRKKMGCAMYYFSLFTDLQLQLNKLNQGSYLSSFSEQEISPNWTKILTATHLFSHLDMWMKQFLNLFIITISISCRTRMVTELLEVPSKLTIKKCTFWIAWKYKHLIDMKTSCDDKCYSEELHYAYMTAQNKQKQKNFLDFKTSKYCNTVNTNWNEH